MEKPVKVIINNRFWYLRGDDDLRLCSHRKVGSMPKYEIVPASGGGAVLGILSEDFKEDNKILTFEGVDKGDVIAKAMAFAERYEAVHSKSWRPC
jgi:hypothetical protein